MKRVQAVALDAFEAKGFDKVSIEDIARAADVGPATVYRYFGTKEGIVLWDEYDPALLDALRVALGERERDVAAATLDALSRTLTTIYAEDGARILRRTSLVRKTPQLSAMTAAGLKDMRAAFALVLRETRRAKDELEARVFAGVLVSVIEVGLDHWLDEGGRLPLERCFRMTFTRLGRLSAQPVA